MKISLNTDTGNLNVHQAWISFEICWFCLDFNFICHNCSENMDIFFKKDQRFLELTLVLIFEIGNLFQLTKLTLPHIGELQSLFSRLQKFVLSWLSTFECHTYITGPRPRLFLAVLLIQTRVLCYQIYATVRCSTIMTKVLYGRNKSMPVKI